LPSWTIAELLIMGLVRGRVKSALTVPSMVSENSHSTRPSGSRTETVLSAPLHRPLVLP
jgi:hypothetical protein